MELVCLSMIYTTRFSLQKLYDIDKSVGEYVLHVSWHNYVHTSLSLCHSVRKILEMFDLWTTEWFSMWHVYEILCKKWSIEELLF